MLGRARRAGNLRHPVEFLIEAQLQILNRNASFGQNSGCQPAFLLEQRGHEVLHVDLLMAEPNGFALCGAKGFLGFLGKAVDDP